MDIEVILFLLVGALSIAAAVMMLLDDNAVQSALFLILNFACVAFLFLMLDAAFLAMVQIAVYAGAIMVLFLFVIMLLGAEKITSETVRDFRWIAPLALVLALSFLIAIYAAVTRGNVDEREPVPANPLVRVAYIAPDFLPAVNVFLDDERIADGIELRDFSDYVEVEPGSHTIALGPADGDVDEALPLDLELNLEPDTITTLVAHNDPESALPVIDAVREDLSTLEKNNTSRLIVFNSYSEADGVNLAAIDSDYLYANLADAQSAKIYAEDIPYGAVSDVLTFDHGDLRAVFVPSDPDLADQIILRLRDFELPEDTSTFMILGADDSEEPETVAFITSAVTDADFQFGGPQSVGISLFTKYVLPLEMVAMLLLSAMVGAIVLTQRTEPKPKPGRPTRRKVSRPLTSVIASQTGHSLQAEVDEQDYDVVEEPVGD